MAWDLDYPEHEHQTRLAIADPIATAYEWIKAYAENLSSICNEEHENPVEVDELIEIGMSWAVDNGRWGGNYLVRGGALEGHYMDPTFWDKLAIIKGITIPSEKRHSFFSCSC